MGEARRRLAGTYPTWSQPLSRGAATTWAMEVLAATEDGSVGGVTIFPADGSDTNPRKESLIDVGFQAQMKGAS